MRLNINQWLKERDPYVGYRYQVPFDHIDWINWTQGNDIDMSGQNQPYVNMPVEQITARVLNDGGQIDNPADLNEIVSLLSGLNLWDNVLCFANSRIAVKVADGKCSTLYDISNGVDDSRDFVQTDTSKQPSYTTTQLVFDNVNDQMTGNSGLLSILRDKPSVTVFLQLKATEWTDIETPEYLYFGQGTANARLSMNIKNKALVVACTNADGGAISDGHPFLSFLDNSTVITSTVDYTNRKIKTWLNGAFPYEFTGAFGTGANTSDTDSYIAGIGINHPANAGIISILIIDGVVSDADRIAIETLMINKWNIPLAVQNPIALSRYGRSAFIVDTPITMQSITITSPATDDDIGNWQTEAHMVCYDDSIPYWDGTFADYFLPGYIYTYSGDTANGTVTLSW